MPRATKTNLILSVLVLLAVAGAAVALMWPETRSGALQAMGGSVVSGAIVGLALLFYEQAAEERRERRAEERQIALIERTDLLNQWAQLDTAATSQLIPVLELLDADLKATFADPEGAQVVRDSFAGRCEMYERVLDSHLRPLVFGTRDADITAEVIDCAWLAERSKINARNGATVDIPELTKEMQEAGMLLIDHIRERRVELRRSQLGE